MAPRNSYTLDGVPLTNLAAGYFLEKKTGLRLIPAKRMANISYPAVSGNSFMPGAPFAAGGVAVTMYVEGADHQQFMERVEFLNGLFLQRHKLLELRHDYDAAGTVARIALVTCVSSTDIVYEHGMKSGTISYYLEVPGSFWRSPDTQTYMSAPITANRAVFSITTLNGGNAPVADALIRVKGAFSTFNIRDEVTGSEINITTPLAAGEYIIIDTANWTAHHVLTDTWDGGTVGDTSVISNRGMGTMLMIEPAINAGQLAYTMSAVATNPASAPTFEIRAKKSHL